MPPTLAVTVLELAIKIRPMESTITTSAGSVRQGELGGGLANYDGPEYAIIRDIPFIFLPRLPCRAVTAFQRKKA